MPMALPFIAMGLSAAGTAYSAISSIKKGEYDQQIANQNAQIAGQNATAAGLRGMAEREALTTQASQMISKQRAAAGTSGADVQSSSIVDTLAATRLMSALDLEKSAYNTAMETRGYGIQKSNFTAQGDAAAAAGTNGAIGSLLTGAGNLAAAGSSLGKTPGATGTPYLLARPGAGYDPATFPRFGG